MSRNSKSAPTLHDVARRAGVSTATVSRALNTPDAVVESTRALVLRSVEELGYTPNFGGRALVSNRYDTVGAVIPTMDNAMFARGLQAFQETLAEAGVTLLVASSGYDPQREFQQIQTLVGRGTDGVLLIGAERPDTSYDFLERRGIPFVVAWTLRQHEHRCFVGFDNRLAATEMTRRVLEYGHRRVAMVAGKCVGNDRAQDRVEGVRKALDDAGLNGAAMPVVEAPYSVEAARNACAALLSREPRPSVIICGNDVLAVGVMSHAKSVGLSIPRDLSVTGFDDIELAAVTDPALTTVRVPQRSMGEAAARSILALRAGTTDSQTVDLSTRIVTRDSLAAPKPD